MAKDDQFKEALGNRLRGLRLDAGLTLTELAEKSGVSYRTIIDIEKADTRPSVEVIRLLCIALEYSLSDFFKFKY
ncbi:MULTISPECIES: helix-turn-helix domain-containing protein [Aquimarina]|uniref:Helix-turn-helix transcriptional regulator n=1 Tax=Aquimarina algiphila TaxID=2047982 RepID=A0A554VDJ3_9FLAO|nr:MULTISPECIES: helix-turn-helix transcriptional regulator [Aquimarina]TSE04902.1 helix-turn-helix transcriptional regulator [Aquimarina algiphila]